jgi:catechol 2,3-dioxygenase-like lactoylglutathione lyase family enzyme
MKTSLTHVRINVSDLQKSLDWYVNILGFEKDSVWPVDNPTYIDFHPGKGATFSIMEVPVGSNFQSGRFNFDTEDVDILWNELKDKVEILEPLFDTPWGGRKFTIKDLDGNEIGFG